jgi:hypothetical protein
VNTIDKRGKSKEKHCIWFIFQWIFVKKCCKEKLGLERRLVCKKKEKKTVLNMAADAKP